MAAKQLASSNLATPPETYLYNIACAGSTYVTIGSDDSLRLFNLPDLKVSRTISAAHTGLSCLASGSSSEIFLTGGRDARIRIWDHRSASPTASIEITEPKGAGFSALKCAGNFVAAGTESTKEGLGDVSVLVYDLRSPATPIRIYAESHTDTITSLTWHPTQSNHMSKAWRCALSKTQWLSDGSSEAQIKLEHLESGRRPQCVSNEMLVCGRS